MKPFKTEAMFFFSSYLFLLVISSTVQSRPCDVVQKTHCDKCSSLANCYDSDESSECNWCCECDPSTYVIDHCSGNDPTNTVCEPCSNNTYTSTPNHQRSCNASKPLDFCDRIVNTKLVLGDSSHDNRCVCKDGFFGKNPEISGCKAHLQCPAGCIMTCESSLRPTMYTAGFGVRRLGNETDDTECEYCQAGLCSNVTSATDKCEICNRSSSPPTSSTTSATSTSSRSAISGTASPSIGVGGVFLGMGVMFIVGVLPCIFCLCWLRKEKMKDEREKEQEREKKQLEKKKQKEYKSKKSGSKQPMLEMTELLNKGESQSRESISLSGEGYTCHERDPLIVEEKKTKEILDMASPILPNVDRFKDKFREAGYEVVYEPEPDNQECMFRAIAYLMVPGANTPDDEVTENARELRRLLRNYLSENEATYRRRVNQDWVDYLNDVSENYIGDEIMVEALNRIISRHIQIIRLDGTFINERREDIAYQNNDILIGYVRDSYYVALHRMGTEMDVRDEELKDVIVHQSPDDVTDGGASEGEETEDTAPFSDPSASDILPANHPQSSNPLMPGTSQAFDLLQHDDTVQDSTGDAPTPSMQAQEINPSEHPTPQPEAVDSMQMDNPEQDQSVIEPTSVQQPTDPSLSLTSEPYDPSRDDYPSTNDQASTSQQQPTSEEDSGTSNSAQEPTSTALKLPVAARQFEEDIALFNYKSDQKELHKVDPKILHEALKSSDYLQAMCDHLIDNISSKDLKEMIRTLKLLEEITIGDIEYTYSREPKELRRNLMKEIRYKFGDDINPGILLKKAYTYPMRKPYDDLCRGFINHLRYCLGNNSTT